MKNSSSGQGNSAGLHDLDYRHKGNLTAGWKMRSEHQRGESTDNRTIVFLTQNKEGAVMRVLRKTPSSVKKKE